jgi:hypothetical protein
MVPETPRERSRSRVFPARRRDGEFACYTAGASYIPTLAKTSSDRLTCTAADVLTDAQRQYILSTLLPTAVGFWSSALSVIPVVGPLILNNPMPDYSCFGSTWYYSLMCCASFFPPAYMTAGVPNADYLLIVTARPTGGAVLAWATECQSDQFGRSLCGQANLSPARISTLSADLAAQVGVVTHETAHALGFSASKFSAFRQPGTQLTVNPTDVTSFGYDINLQKMVTRIVTPNVVSFLKAHLGCNNWADIGGELEDYGGAGTAGSHWDKRIAMNELMNPSSEPVMVKSGLTLSYFADSGWYAVDMTKAEKLSWGLNQGCDFLRLQCSSGWSDAYFCRNIAQGGCTADMRFQAACNLADNAYITYPSNHQYFPGSPGKAGTNPYADYCPFYQGFTSRDCSSPTTVAYYFYGEAPGTGSRCFAGTYQLAKVTSAPTSHGGCLQTKCMRGLIQITLQGYPTATVITCPQAGGAVDMLSVSGGQYMGSITCPPASQLCTGNPCDLQDCSGRGACNPADGSCKCNPGYYGISEPVGSTVGNPGSVYSCPYVSCPTTNASVACSGHGSCNTAIGLCTNGVLTTAAGCYPGWKASAPGVLDCGAPGCPTRSASLGECSGRGTCIAGSCSCTAGYIGSDCWLTDCPYSSVNGQRCGGLSQGTCNLDSGVCECLDFRSATGEPGFFQGSACATQVNNTARPYTRLAYLFEPTGPWVNATLAVPVFGSLRYKETSYYDFIVPTTSYAISLSVTSTMSYTVAVDTYLTASYDTSARPTTTSSDFTSTVTTGSTRTINLTPSSASGSGHTTGSSAFSNTGRILVAITSLSAYSSSPSGVTVTISLARDGCAVMQCAHGSCLNGRCICDTAIMPTGESFGWAGQQCDVADCPGTPDCTSSKRGRCVVPPGAWLPNGTAVRGTASRPYCTCSSTFAGSQACSTYSALTSAGANVIGSLPLTGWLGAAQYNNFFIVGVNELRNTPAADGCVDVNNLPSPCAPAWVVKNLGGNTNVTVINTTLTGSLGMGDSIPALVIDQPGVLAYMRLRRLFDEIPIFPFAGATLGVYIRLTSFSPRADAIMLGDTDAPPTLTTHRDFDEPRWRDSASVQEISTVLNPSGGEGDFYVVTLLNGKYGQDALSYSIFAEIATGCPPSLRGCSGHGSCSYRCVCDVGWEGIICGQYIPEIVASAVNGSAVVPPAAATATATPSAAATATAAPPFVSETATYSAAASTTASVSALPSTSAPLTSSATTTAAASASATVSFLTATATNSAAASAPASGSAAPSTSSVGTSSGSMSASAAPETATASRSASPSGSVAPAAVNGTGGVRRALGAGAAAAGEAAPAAGARRVQALTAPSVDTPPLLPGGSITYIATAADSSVEVFLTLTQLSLGALPRPMLKAAWSPTRGNAGIVTSSFAVYDYDAASAGNGTQSILLRRVNPSQQRFLYVSLENDARARSSFAGRISVDQSAVSTTALCTGTAAACRASVCRKRGTYSSVNGVPGCSCDLGWNADTLCASPFFTSLADIVPAAQSMGFLCSVCSTVSWMGMNGVRIFKVPQPLQSSTGLLLTAKPVPGVAGGNSSSSVIVSSAMVPSANASGLSTTGSPSILISTVLPRSLLDFSLVVSGASTINGSASILLREPSPTGSYWVAVYANSPGTISLAASRSRTPTSASPNSVLALVAGLDTWLIGTTAGIVIIAIGAVLCCCTCTSCLLQCFCGRVTVSGKLRAQLSQLEEERNAVVEAEAKRRRDRESALRRLAESQSRLKSNPALRGAIGRRSSRWLGAPNPMAVSRPFVAPGSDFTVPQHVPTGGWLGGTGPPTSPRPARRQAGPSLLMQAMQGDGGVASAVHSMPLPATLSGYASPTSLRHTAAVQSQDFQAPARYAAVEVDHHTHAVLSSVAGSRASSALPPGAKGGRPPPWGSKGGHREDFAGSNPMGRGGDV